MAKITHIRNKQNIKASKKPEDPQQPEAPRLTVKKTFNAKVKNGKEDFNGIKVALVCIAKNEDNYIQEWITYNKLIGFDDIFIYQNDIYEYHNEDPEDYER